MIPDFNASESVLLKRFSDKAEHFLQMKNKDANNEFLDIFTNLENGCISFSDLRNSTTFLNKYGKNLFRNSIQQPFFEKTKLVSKKYTGRIDKFMGDNVMCAFLQAEDEKQHEESD